MADVDSGKYRGYALVVEKMDRFSRMDIDETSDYIRRSRVVNPPGKQLGTVIQNVVEAWQAEDYVKNLTANVTKGWAIGGAVSPSCWAGERRFSRSACSRFSSRISRCCC